MRSDLRDQVEAIVLPGETVLDVTDGYIVGVGKLGRRSLLFVTDRRVGIYTRKVGGHSLVDFAFGLITSVDYKRGLIYAEISILAAGDAMRIQQVPKDEVERVGQEIRRQLALARDPAAPGRAPVATIAAELSHLSELHEGGILTDEEFAAAKAKLLGL